MLSIVGVLWIVISLFSSQAAALVSDLAPSYSLTFVGNYLISSTPKRRDVVATTLWNVKNENEPEERNLLEEEPSDILDFGQTIVQMFSKSSTMNGLRIAYTLTTFDSQMHVGSRFQYLLSGWDMQFGKRTGDFEGTMKLRDVPFLTVNAASRYSFLTQTPVCPVTALHVLPLKVGHFRSIRPMKSVSTLLKVGGIRSLEEEEDDSGLMMRPLFTEENWAGSEPYPPINYTEYFNKKAPLVGTFYSDECKLYGYIDAEEINISDVATSVLRFAFLFNIKTLLEMKFLMSQIAEMDASSSGAKISLLGIVMGTFVEVFEGAYVLLVGIQADFMISHFVIVSLFNVLLVGLLQVRYLMDVLSARVRLIRAGGGSQAALRSELVRLLRYLFMSVLIILFTVLRLFEEMPLLILSVYFFWVPQILTDIWKGQKNSLTMQYVIGTSIARLLFPVYLWSYPFSIFDGKVFAATPGAPSVLIPASIITLVALQVIVIIVQRVFGPRCLVPLSLLPHVYDYYRPIAKNPADQESARDLCCVVCITEVADDGTGVITPCDHVFHDQCLKEWMKFRLECPVCRGNLPPFAD